MIYKHITIYFICYVYIIEGFNYQKGFWGFIKIRFCQQIRGPVKYRSLDSVGNCLNVDSRSHRLDESSK